MPLFNECRKPKVVYLGLSLELYRAGGGPAPAEWEGYFREWSSVLAERAEIVASGCCYLESEVRAVMEKGRLAGAEAAVVSALSYTASLTSVPALSEYEWPVIVWNTQQMREIAADYTPADLLRNHTVQGVQDVANLLFRRRMKFIVVSGWFREPAVLERLDAAMTAARALRPVRTLSLGGRFFGMGDFEFHPSDILAWHASFDDLPMEEYRTACQEVPADELNAQTAADFADFEIEPGLSRELHRESLRPYLALKKLLARHRSDAFTMNFSSSDFRGKFLPLHAVNRLMADGLGYAGEGDSLRAVWMARLIRMAGSANFTEIYTVDFVRNRFFMTHMQECNPLWARRDRKIRLKNQPFWTAGFGPYTGMYFTLEPGPVTLTGVTPDADGKLRYIVFTGEIEDVPPLPDYDRAHWFCRVNSSAAALLDRYSEAGGPHHLIAVRGDLRNELKLLARFDGAEYLDITEERKC